MCHMVDGVQLFKKHNLNIVDTVSLPTIWTFDQTIETPYIYTKFN